MKSKPADLNTTVEQWRAPDPEKVISRADGRDARISKTVRMRLRYSEMLRDEAYKRSVEKGEKVSEADLLDEALSDWRLKHQLSAE